MTCELNPSIPREDISFGTKAAMSVMNQDLLSANERKKQN